MIKLEIEQTYQGCATRIYQDVEQVQEQIIIPNDKGEAHSLQQPVDHVEPQRN